MKQQKTMIFFGDHPDDETFGMGSTLAQYVNAGVRVYYVCATRGEAGTVEPEFMQGFASIADLRTNEMKCAAQILGLAGVIYLGYRDSGMSGSPDNKNPEALVMAPVDEVAALMVRIIRELRPDVVITHDAGGGYGHPAHIAVHNATLKAFYAAGDLQQYPTAGEAFQPLKLYFGVRPHGFMKIMVKIMPLFGLNPHQFGRNKDIDLTRMINVNYPVNAEIRLNRQSVEIRDKAAACHASQGGGRFRPGPFILLRIVENLRGQRDYFTRDYPPSTGRRREKDLFEGIN